MSVVHRGPRIRMCLHHVIVRSLTLALIMICVGALVVAVSRTRRHRPLADQFTNAPLVVGDDEGIVMVDAMRLSDIVFYTSAFSSSSYGGSGRVWTNVASSGGTSHAKFDREPTFSRKDGFGMGRNVLFGPLSSDLGLDLRKTFTIVMACAHDRLDTSNGDIEVLKLYANSGNNNGITLRVSHASSVNDAQSAMLSLDYLNYSPINCTADPTHASMSVRRECLSFYVIVKDVDRIRVCFSDDRSITALATVAQQAIPQEDETTFSNKELVVNRNGNWNGRVYSVAMFAKTLGPVEMVDVCRRINSRYTMENDDGYGELNDTYTGVIEKIRRDGECPFGTAVCESCRLAGVDDWGDVHQLLKSTVCRQAIDGFCGANPTHPRCAECYDSGRVTYNSSACKSYRGMMHDSNLGLFDTLSLEELQYVKLKNNLAHVDPATVFATAATPSAPNPSPLLLTALTIAPIKLARSEATGPLSGWQRFRTMFG